MTDRRPEVLYVDDSPDDRLFARLSFERGDYPFSLSILETASAVLADLRERVVGGQPLPALLVADHYMPVTDGPELLRLVRAIPQLDGMTLAVCSGSDARADIEKAELAGAGFLLAKPLDLEICVDILAREMRVRT